MYALANALCLPLRDESVHCIVTSTAYWGRRNYGESSAEIGRHDLADYWAETYAWTAEAWRVLDGERGFMWLNIGDTFSGSGGAGGDYNRGGTKLGQRRYRQGKSGIARMQQCLVPQNLALILQGQGWLVRKWITWDKGQTEQQDPKHVRRPLDASEVILMLTKGHDHPWYHDRLPERGDVWHFPPVRGPRRGPAPFPEELPRRCIAASTNPGDIVLDPFTGVGTTVRVARAMDRIGIGTDLYLNGGHDNAWAT